MFVYPVIIEETEKRWICVLYDACRQQFQDTYLPSHDHTHHFRVWQNAKRLMFALNASGVEFSQSDIEELIIAVFFHDTGLTVTLDEKHGKEGSIICEKFFNSNKFEKPAKLANILRKIENHEDKNYQNIHLILGSMDAILAAADDIDAFGTIGVFRYAEIYLLRKVKPENLSESIIPNLDKRFRNLQKLYGSFDEFFNEIRLKYWITREFYQNLGQKDKPEVSKEACKIIEIFLSDIMQRKAALKEMAIETAFNHDSSYVREFFTMFAAELDKCEFRIVEER